MRKQVVRLALALVLGGLPIAGRCQYVEPPTVKARLASGREVETTWHRPGNALKAAARAGDAVVAAMPDGRLLRFDGPDLRLTAEREANGTVECLGTGPDGGILAGLDDGRVCRVDPKTLELAEIVKLPERPAWVGWSPAAGDGKGGVVAAAGKTIHDVAAHRAIDTGNAATACLVDREGRLWVGADRGERGGRVARVDLRAGTFVEVPPLFWSGKADRRPSPFVTGSEPPRPDAAPKPWWRGVHGFVELDDGRILAYGGLTPASGGVAFVARVDDLSGRLTFTYDSFDFTKGPNAPVPSGPTAAVTHVVRDGDGLFVLARDGVFRVDPDLTTWKKAADPRLRYAPDQPGVMGEYPAVVAVLPPSRPGGAVLMATTFDGLIEIDGARVRTRAVSGRLGASDVRRIANTAEGLLFFEGDDEGTAWKLAPDGWRAVDLAPPFEIDPNNDAPQFESELRDWARTRVLVGPDGSITTVGDSGVSPGTVTTARREDGRTVVLGRETSVVRASGCFATPDGVLWNSGGDGWLRRFSDGRWRRVAETSQDGPSAPVALATKRPPWILFSPSSWADLGDDWQEFAPGAWRLDPRVDGVEPHLSRVELREGDAELKVREAAPWTDDSVLLWTDAGPRVYYLRGTIAKVALPALEGRPAVHARDGLGRFWLGGEDGLRLAPETFAKDAETFANVPPIAGAEVTALAPDPNHPDGVVAALGARGVVFVRASREP